MFARLPDMMAVPGLSGRGDGRAKIDVLVPRAFDDVQVEGVVPVHSQLNQSLRTRCPTLLLLNSRPLTL